MNKSYKNIEMLIIKKKNINVKNVVILVSIKMNFLIIYYNIKNQDIV